MHPFLDVGDYSVGGPSTLSRTTKNEIKSLARYACPRSSFFFLHMIISDLVTLDLSTATALRHHRAP
jgi:hypothetical protein